MRGGVSQYFRDDRYSAFTDAPDEVTQSALLSFIDLSVRREGDRFDFVSRVNGVYVYDMLDDDADRQKRIEELLEQVKALHWDAQTLTFVERLKEAGFPITRESNGT